MLVIIVGSTGTWFRIAAILLVASLTTGLMTAAALTGEQLRAFGSVTADQRRHRSTLILITLVVCAVSFGVDAVANALSGGLPWWCLGVAALLSFVALVVRAISSGASGDDTALIDRALARTPAAAPDRGNLFVEDVRRQWLQVVKTIVALVFFQMLVRVVLPGFTGTVVFVLMMVVGMTAIIAGTGLSWALTTVVVFGGSRKSRSRAVLREGAVLPMAGLLGAAVALGMEKIFADWLSWADPSLLVTANSVSDMVFILIAGTATGVIVLVIGLLSALADQTLPGWASIIALMVGAATVTGLLYLVGPEGADGWAREWWASTGGTVICVVGGMGLVPLLTRLVSHCSMREDLGMANWYGLRTREGTSA